MTALVYRPALDGEVHPTSGVIAVKTPMPHGAYALSIPLDGLRKAANRTVRVKLGNIEGDIGLGMLGADKSSWFSREMAHAGQTHVELDLPASGQASELIVFNAGDGQARATCDVEGLELQGSMGPTPVSTAALSLHPRNALDPLDDGMNPLGRLPRFACKAVYYNLYINELFLRINPSGGVGGSDDVWQSPPMVALRRSLNEGSRWLKLRVLHR